jgi:hypothetical protein
MSSESKLHNTSDIVLPKELLEIKEILAENVHECWSRRRLREGWRYGKTRDEKTKVTQCLVPYSELPEEEKNYDRQTALETVKLLLKLGFKISR